LKLQVFLRKNSASFDIAGLVKNKNKSSLQTLPPSLLETPGLSQKKSASFGIAGLAKKSQSSLQNNHCHFLSLETQICLIPSVLHSSWLATSIFPSIIKNYIYI
jgi:hypothetical protein